MSKTQLFYFCSWLAIWLLNELQRKKKLINQMHNNTREFENKLRLWQFQWRLNKMACILTLRMEKPTHTKISTNISQVLQNEFYSQFQDFRQYQATFIVLSAFVVSIKTVPHDFQLVLLNYSVVKKLQHKYEYNYALLLTYHFVIYFQCPDTMHNKQHVGGTYICKQLHSNVSNVMSPYRNQPDSER